jgi:hypothetical protein
VTQSIDVLELRELFLQTSDLEASRWLAVGLSAVLVTLILLLVRRRKLREEYTPIWLAVGAVLVVLSVRLDLLVLLSRAIGAWTAASTIFFLGELFLVAICLNYAVRLSRTGLQLKNLAQELAILRAEVEALRAGGTGA